MENFSNILDSSSSLLGNWIALFNQPWQALPLLKEKIEEVGKRLPANDYQQKSPGVWVHKSAKISHTAEIVAPCIVCEGAEIRHNAFLRGGVLVGKCAVVGNSVELKNCVLFDGAKVPHLSYVGDSILGKGAHLGASTIVSNVRLDKATICVKYGNKKEQTNLKKFGAIVGDETEIGCGSVLCPGTIIMPRSAVFPLTCVRGVFGREQK